MKKQIIDKRNKYRVSGDTAHLTIIKRNGKKHSFTFDTNRLTALKQHCWGVASGHDYLSARTRIGTEPIHLQRFLLLDKLDSVTQKVGFIDGDSTNCRESNLVVGTHQEICLRGAEANRQQQKGKK